MKSRRNTELLLLLAALPILVLIFAMALLNSEEPVSISSFAVPLGLFAAFVLAHLTTRRFAPSADPAILPLTFLLSGIGIAFVMRLAPDLAIKQTGWLFLAIAAMIVVLILVRSLENLARYKYTIMLVGLILLLLPALIGVEHYGSKIWLSIAGLSFQPGEIAKVLIVLFLASYLADSREMLSVATHKILGLNIPDFRTLAPLLVMWVISLIIVVFERDLGSALLFFGIFLIMLYACTGRLFYILGGLLLAAIGFTGAYFIFDHVQARVAIWLDPFKAADGNGYQLVQALYSMADGGLFGTGIGRGLPTKIPVVESDFIFAAIAEETGLLGAAGVLLLYVLFTVRGFLTAAQAKNDISAFCAVGLTAAISLQAFVIVGGVTKLIPLTGLTLPFMSQGGSSLLASFIIVALLLRAGDEGTGHGTEMRGVTTIDGGLLGRVALGKRLTQLVTMFVVLFAMLIGNLTYIQVIKADYYQTLPTNNHSIARAARNERGAILTSDNVVLAQSVLSDNSLSYERIYPQGSLASHIVGYASTQYGMAGVEASKSDELTGQKGFSSWTDAINSLSGKSVAGNDIVLTIDSTVQKVAESALEGKKGAVVALDPETGAVLAMASSPTYDPNNVAELLSGTSESDALYNRASQALYAPGSTFKIATLAIALEKNIATPSTVYNSPASLEIGGGLVTNFENTDHGDISLAKAIEVSSNTVFAQVATQIGAKDLVAYSKKFGINSNFGQDFLVNTSLMPDPAEMTEWETAWAGVGQPVGEHESPAGPQMTVLQMALIGSAVANDGIVMNPYVVDSSISPAGVTVASTIPRQLSVAVSKSTANTVLDVLRQSVEAGSGSSARVDGVSVAGKTGTAETDKEIDDAWFVGIAPADDPKVVVAVIIEQGGTGSTAAAPITGDVLEAALRAQGCIE